MRKLLKYLILLMAFGFRPAAAADLPKAIEFQVEIRSKGDGIETREQSTIAWWDRRWAESSPEGALIFDLAEDRCVLIDHVHKIWTGGTVNGFLAEMEREITNLAGKVQESYGLPRKTPSPGKNRCLSRWNLWASMRRTGGNACTTGFSRARN